MLDASLSRSRDVVRIVAGGVHNKLLARRDQQK